MSAREKLVEAIGRAKVLKAQPVGTVTQRDAEMLCQLCVDLVDEDGPTLLAALDGQKWQPIETAPMDEAPILLGLPAIGALKEEGAVRVFEGHWDKLQKLWTSMNGVVVLQAATHWMPLPAPPEEG